MGLLRYQKDAQPNAPAKARSLQSLKLDSPALIFLFIALTIFAAEASLMVLFSYLPRKSFRAQALWDAALLVLIVSPALYFYLFRPLVANINERQRVEQRFRTLAEATFEGIAITSQGKLVDLNDQLAGLLGYEPRELIGQRAADLIAPEDRDRVMAGIRAGQGQIEHEMLCKGGSRIVVESHCRSMEQQGLPINLLAVRDVTRRKAQEKEERLAATLYAASSEGMVITDSENHIISVNPAFTAITGYAADEVLGKHPAELCSEHRDDPFYREMLHSLATTNHWVGEVWDKKKDGEPYAVHLTISAILDDPNSGRRYAAQFSDITEKKKMDEIIAVHANFDSLTGLPNRRLFRDHLEHEIRKSRRSRHSVALMFIDLDHFKEVNDTLGHLAGDRLLVEAAKRIVSCVRESDIVSRIGGDEFTVILSEISDVNRIENVAHAIIHTLSQPYPLAEEAVNIVSGSVGITVYPDDATNPDDLIRNADQAMYLSKSEGRNCFHFFTEAMQEAILRQHQLGQDLRTALHDKQLQLHFQPIVDLRTGGLFKAEALLRWRHPVRGMVSPDEFIPVAEEIRLIDEISDWVVSESMEHGSRWAKLTGRAFRIGVNISPVQFMGKGHGHLWIDHVRGMTRMGNSVSIEITEGTLLSDRPDVVASLHAVHDAGVEVAIDDFGTGYSSLSYLQKFKVDYLKIDRSFTRNLAPGSTDLALSEAIIVMAHKLGMKVIAEGIETEAQRDLLVAAGCDFGQGYLFSKPVPGEEFERLLRKGAMPHRPIH